MWYNLRVKTYADGTQSFMFYEKPRNRDYTLEEIEHEHDGSTVERKKIDSNKRAIQRVYDLARSNDFDWFVTLTLSPEKVNRYDYEACAKCVGRFTNWLSKRGGKWVLVAEQHKDGAYHFHGLISGDMKLVHHKDDIYNIANFEWGFTTATAIRDRARVASYIGKYLTKCFSVPKGKKRYWASRNLEEPKIEYLESSAAEFGEVFNSADYTKIIESDYGRFMLCEVAPKESE